MKDLSKGCFKISKDVILAIFDGKPIQQVIVERLSKILNAQRCVIFIISADNEGTYCEMTVGVPADEHGFGLKEIINSEKHPDIWEVVWGKAVLHIKDPELNPLTAHLTEIVRQKNISEILYIPLVIKIAFEAENKDPKAIRMSNEKSIGVIVIDALDGRKFSEEEVEFCAEVGQLLSLIINQEEIFIQKARDRSIGSIVSLGAFAKRIRDEAEVIIKNVAEIEESLFPHAGDVLKKGDGKKKQ